MNKYKEVYVGTSLTKISELKDILLKNKIQYKIKTISNEDSNFSIFTMFFNSGRRAKGSYGVQSEYAKTYYLYVKKSDYDKAKYLLFTSV